MSAVRFTVTKAEDNPIGGDAPNYGSRELQAVPTVKVENERSNGTMLSLFTYLSLMSYLTCL